MGVSATASLSMAYSVANATAKEVKAVGVNLILGPVLDVLSNARLQPIGVRSSGDDPQEVSQYSIEAINGYKDAGLATCGKHFPTYGNLDFQGSSLDIPIITQTFEELKLNALVPYRSAIATGNLDAVFVGGCGIASANMKVSHACLSEFVVDDLLRQDLGFDGVAISECLEMEALYQEIGVKGGTVMAVEAGCDLILLCRDFNVSHGLAAKASYFTLLGVTDGCLDPTRRHRWAQTGNRERHYRTEQNHDFLAESLATKVKMHDMGAGSQPSWHIIAVTDAPFTPDTVKAGLRKLHHCDARRR